jgi:proteic killer suppression protein
LDGIVYLCQNKGQNMDIEFDKEYLRELYEYGVCQDKKHRFQPSVVKKYQKRIDTLACAVRIENLFPLNSLNLERLEGTENRFSIRVDLQYRLEFELSVINDKPMLTLCNILELSNHYK